MHACMFSWFSNIRLFAALWTVAHPTPLPVGFSRQEFWSGFPCPPRTDLPDPGIKPMFLVAPALAGRFFTTSAKREYIKTSIFVGNDIKKWKKNFHFCQKKKKSLWFYFSHLECSAFNLIILFICLVRLYSSSLYFQFFFFWRFKVYEFTTK